jgi:hypothetical protein
MTTDPRIISIAAFVKRRLPKFRHVQREALLAWVNWYWAHGYVGIVRHHGRIVSVGFCRPLVNVEDAEERWSHAEDGKIIWIDDVASRHPDGLLHLFRHTIQRFGPREAFAGWCLSRDGELRMLPWAAVNKLIDRTDYGHDTA